VEKLHRMVLEGEGVLLTNHLAGVVAEELQAQNDLEVEVEGVGLQTRLGEAEGAVLQTRLGEVEVEVYRAPQFLPQEEAEAAEQKDQNDQGVAGEALGVSLRLSQEK
jgi:hypothetical protein